MSTTFSSADFPAVQDLPRKAASELKTAGWPETVRAVQDLGKLVVTNHNRPEAVIMAVREYQVLVDYARAQAVLADSVLEELRREYDERLSVLRGPTAAKRLRASIRKPIKLGAKVRVGQPGR